MHLNKKSRYTYTFRYFLLYFYCVSLYCMVLLLRRNKQQTNKQKHVTLLSMVHFKSSSSTITELVEIYRELFGAHVMHVKRQNHITTNSSLVKFSFNMNRDTDVRQLMLHVK